MILKAQQLKTENEKREKYELLRWQTTMIINPHLRRSLKPEQLVKFDWEKEDINEAEIADIAKNTNWDELDNLWQRKE